MWQRFTEAFYQNFIEEDRWKYLADGLQVTLLITFFALFLGLFIGFVVAVIKSTYENTGKLKILNVLCSLYTTVIRGTPIVVQLILIYFGIFASVRIDKVLVAIIGFGFNSGAYQAEIFRAGIQAVPKGQFEAGRSLGFSYQQTMTKIIMPQAIKNAVPTLGNEFIVLLKETSIAGYIALVDLTKGGDIIRTQTYAPFAPMLGVAVIYLAMVVPLTYLVGLLERRLKKSER